MLPFLGIDPKSHSVKPIGAGLIHGTYVVEDQHNKPAYIFQHLNTNVFRVPEDISWNLRQLQSFLKEQGSDYFIPLPLQTPGGEDYLIHDGQYFRLSPFVMGCSAPSLAF